MNTFFITFFFIFSFISFSLSQDPYQSFDNLDDFFHETVGSIKRNRCPMRGIHDSNFCPDKNFLENFKHHRRECGEVEDINEYTSTVLISFDPVTKEQKLPIVDEYKSRVTTIDYMQTLGAMKQEYFPKVFESINSYYDDFLSFSSEGTFRNGMFMSGLSGDMMKFFAETFGLFDQTVYISVNQKEYISMRKEVKLENMVLTEQVQNIVDIYLPEEYDEKKYALFFKEFGAYTATACNFGGLFEAQTFLKVWDKKIFFFKFFSNLSKDCLTKKIPLDQIEDYLKKDADGLINDPTQRKGVAEYIHKSKIKETVVYGGDPREHDTKKRIDTFPTLPVPTTCTWIPIYKLVKNAKKSQNMKTYLTKYLASPMQKRKEEYAQIEVEKKKQWDNSPMNVVLVSTYRWEYEEMRISKGQIQSKCFSNLGYKQCFYCECDHAKFCRCETDLFHRGKEYGDPKLVGGVSDLGVYTWSHKHCHGHWFWKHCHTDTVSSHIYGLINCEMIRPDNHDCYCKDFPA